MEVKAIRWTWFRRFVPAGKLTMSGGSNAFLFKRPFQEKSPIFISQSLLIPYSTFCNLMFGSKNSRKRGKIFKRNFQLFYMLGCGDQAVLRKWFTERNYCTKLHPKHCFFYFHVNESQWKPRENSKRKIYFQILLPPSYLMLILLPKFL